MNNDLNVILMWIYLKYEIFQENSQYSSTNSIENTDAFKSLHIEENQQTEKDQTESDVIDSDNVSLEIQQETETTENPKLDQHRHENDEHDVPDDSFYDIPNVAVAKLEESPSKIGKSLPTLPARPDPSSKNNNQIVDNNPYSVVKKKHAPIIYSQVETRTPPSSDNNGFQAENDSKPDQIKTNQTSLANSHKDKTLPNLPQQSSINIDLQLYDIVPNRNVQHADNASNDLMIGLEDNPPFNNQQPKANLVDGLEMGNFYDYPNIAVVDDERMQQIFQEMQPPPTSDNNNNISSNPHHYPDNNSNNKRPPVSTNPFINAEPLLDHPFDAKLPADGLFDFSDTSDNPPVVEENNYSLAGPMQELSHRPQARNTLELPNSKIQARDTTDNSNHDLQTRKAIDRSAYNKQTRNADISNNMQARSGPDARMLATNNQVKEITPEVPVSNPKMSMKARSSSLSYEIQTTLLHCPCYFVNLSRTTAARYCLSGQPSYSGTFLIRQSESSDGFALTFNCNGNIKVNDIRYYRVFVTGSKFEFSSSISIQYTTCISVVNVLNSKTIV